MVDGQAAHETIGSAVPERESHRQPAQQHGLVEAIARHHVHQGAEAFEVRCARVAMKRPVELGVPERHRFCAEPLDLRPREATPADHGVGGVFEVHDRRVRRQRRQRADQFRDAGAQRTRKRARVLHGPADVARRHQPQRLVGAGAVDDDIETRSAVFESEQRGQQGRIGHRLLHLRTHPLERPQAIGPAEPQHLVPDFEMGRNAPRDRAFVVVAVVETHGDRGQVLALA